MATWGTDKALETFEDAKEYHPKNKHAEAMYYTMLLILDTSNTENLDKLKEIYDDTEDLRQLQNIIVFLNDREEFTEAKKLLEYALESHPDNFSFLTSMGVWHAKQNNLQDAEKYFLQAYNNGGSKDIALLNNLGLLYRDLGDETNRAEEYKKSADYYNQVLKLDPDNEYALNGVEIANENYSYSFTKIYEIINWQLSAITILAVSVTEFFMYKTFRSIQNFPNRIFWKIFPKYNMAFQLIIVILMCLITIPITLNIASLYYGIEINVDGDVTNWATMVSEITVGVMIAVVILVYEMSKQSKFSEQQEVIEGVVTDISSQQSDIEDTVTNITNHQEKISKLVEDVKQIQKEQHEFIKNENERVAHWKERFGNLIYEDLSTIKQNYVILESWLKKYRSNTTPEEKSNTIRNSENLGESVKFSIQNILRFLPKIESSFKDPVLGMNITILCKQYPTLFFSIKEDHVWTPEGLEGTLQMIEEMKKMLDRDMQRIIDEGAHVGEE